MCRVIEVCVELIGDVISFPVEIVFGEIVVLI